MTEYSWALIRDQCIQAWGTIPGGQLESDIIEVFEQSPALVVATIDKTTSAYKAGRITNPWAILRLELQKAASPDRNPIATDETERDKAIARAEAWMRQAGMHYPTEQEILDYLFGIEQFTPPLKYLQQLEVDTRGRPGRPLYDGLLRASIRHTQEHGVQKVPPSSGPMLARFKTTPIRDRMLTLYRELRPQAVVAELEQEERLINWRRRRDQAAKPKPQVDAA